MNKLIFLRLRSGNRKLKPHLNFITVLQEGVHGLATAGAYIVAHLTDPPLRP
jgi:hypothetical protein